MDIERKARVAIVANTGLGDALWMMILARSFYDSGCAVVFYSDFLCHLRSLFPYLLIQSYPQQEERDSVWKEFDRVIFQHHAPGSKNRLLSERERILYKEGFNLDKSYVWNLQRVSTEEVGSATQELDLCIPKEWNYQLYAKRIVIHPLSADRTKNWRPSQFIKLAKRLQKWGYDPRFIIPPSEKEEWQSRLQVAGLPEPVSLNWLDLARYLYESGYFIGNDASPGHLASLLNIPTLSLFSRKSRAVLYRPDFRRGEVVLPYAFLPGRRLRHHFWQYFLPVHRVLRAFFALSGIGSCYKHSRSLFNEGESA